MMDEIIRFTRRVVPETSTAFVTPFIVPWTPLDLSNLIGFYRADIGVSETGGNVTSWADQSIQGQNLASILGTPTWSATGFNTSFPGVLFTNASGLDGIGNTTFVCSTTTFSVFILCSFVTSGDLSNARLVTLWDGTSANDYLTPSIVLYSPDPSVTPLFAPSFSLYSSGVIGNGGSPYSYSYPTGGVPVLLGGVLSGTTGNIYFNGTVQGAGTGFSSIVGDDNFWINYDNNAGKNGHVNMSVAYVIVTTSEMSVSDIANLVTWTNTNWGTSF